MSDETKCRRIGRLLEEANGCLASFCVFSEDEEHIDQEDSKLKGKGVM